MAMLAHDILFNDYAKKEGIAVSWANISLENKVPFLLLANSETMKQYFGLANQDAILEQERELHRMVSELTISQAARSIALKKTGLSYLFIWSKNENSAKLKLRGRDRPKPGLPPYGFIDLAKNPELTPEQRSVLSSLDEQPVEVGPDYSLFVADSPTRPLCSLIFCNVWQDHPRITAQAQQAFLSIKEDVRILNQGRFPNVPLPARGEEGGAGTGAGAGLAVLGTSLSGGPTCINPPPPSSIPFQPSLFPLQLLSQCLSQQLSSPQLPLSALGSSLPSPAAPPLPPCTLRPPSVSPATLSPPVSLLQPGCLPGSPGSPGSAGSPSFPGSRGSPGRAAGVGVSVPGEHLLQVRSFLQQADLLSPSAPAPLPTPPSTSAPPSSTTPSPVPSSMPTSSADLPCRNVVACPFEQRLLRVEERLEEHSRILQEILFELRRRHPRHRSRLGKYSDDSSSSSSFSSTSPSSFSSACSTSSYATIYPSHVSHSSPTSPKTHSTS